MGLITEDQAFAEHEALSGVIADQLRPVVLGRQAKLLRYRTAGEKAQGLLGAYDPAADTQYDWPALPDGAVIDLDYAKVFFDGAKLRYYHDASSQGGSTDPVAGYPNRVRTAGVSFRSNGASYPRDDAFYDRDVQFGDAVTVRGVVDGDEYTLESHVAGFAAETVAAVVGDLTADADNAEALTLDVTSEKLAGPDNCINLVPDDPPVYDGLVDGDIEETYTIEVLTSSTGGDHTTARLRVTSASGRDDVASVTPSAAGTPTAIGTRDLNVIFALAAGESCSLNAEEDEVSANDLIAGQVWRVHVQQDFTPVTGLTSGGDYAGAADTVYLLEVTRGGHFDSDDADQTRPQLTVTTSTGVDVSGPTTVELDGGEGSIAVGSQGVTLTFSEAGGVLRKGDRYTIAVTAPAQGELQTLILADNLPEALQAGSDLDLQLFIVKNGLRVSEKRYNDLPNVNYTTAADNLVLKEGITATEASWTDDGALLPLEVTAATAYVEYRAWVDDFVATFGSLSDLDLLEATLGAIHPDNPLCWGVYKALQNSADGASVGFVGVAAADALSDWKDAIDLLAYRERAYVLVPLTNDRAVHTYLASHVAAMSGQRVNLFRRAYLPAQVDTLVELASATTSDDSAVILATLQDDPDASGTQYTYLQATSGNVSFAGLGVRAGDTLRFLYTTDGYGNSVYTEFTVAAVVSNQTLRLSTGHSVAVNTPQKMEVWRTLTNAEVVAGVLARAAALNSTRLSLVWPDEVISGGLTYPGYFLCAALAGLRCSTLPHRSLSHIELTGVDSVPRTTRFLTPAQRRRLQDGGVWLVTQEGTGPVYSQEAITTRQTTEPSLRLDSMATDTDACGFLVLAEMRDFFTRFNISAESLGQALTQLNAALTYLRSHGRTQELGALLADGTVTEFRQHAINKDQMVIGLQLALPIPYSQDVEMLLEV